MADVKKIATRDSYGNALVELAARLGVDASFITTDGRTLSTEGFEEKYHYMTYEAFVNR